MDSKIKKEYLDEPSLTIYDKLIKEYIKKNGNLVENNLKSYTNEQVNLSLSWGTLGED